MVFGHGAAAVMPQLLQSAKWKGKPYVCRLPDDFPSVCLQTANMSELDALHDETANHLKAWREYRRMSQTQLANIVGTTGAVISLLESGDRQLSTKWLHRLAPALGIRPGFLVDYDPRQLDTSTLELIETASAIAEEDRPTAIKVLKGFLKSA